MSTTLVFDHLTKRFGATTAVEDLSATVRPGRVTGFLGPNGAGKTTSLRLLLGLVRPTSGTATFDGRAYAELREPVREVGTLLEATGFHPGRRARDHLRVLAVAARLPAHRPDEVLEQVGLTDAAHRKVGGYSLGMRQRLGLAAALLGDPPVLVLDEPANGLDPQGIRWLRTFLRQLAGGRLVRSGTLADLGGGAATTTTVRSPDAARLVELLTAAGLPGTWVTSDELRVEAPPERVGELAAEHGVVLHRLSGTESGLEDVFLRLTAEGRR
jgi:ABC-2 type transport system ATP-binding protein